MKLFLGCEMERKMTQAVKEKVFFVGAMKGKAETQALKERARKMMKRHTLRTRLDSMSSISGMLMSILSRKPSLHNLRNLRKKESLEN